MAVILGTFLAGLTMKTILLHIHDDTALESRRQVTLDLSQAFGSHIDCLHATPLEEYLKHDPLTAMRLPEEFSDRMKQMRRDLQQRVERQLSMAGAAWDWFHVDDLMSTALVRHSMLSDLIVLTLADRAFEEDEPRSLAGSVVIEARAPVLGVPENVTGLDVAAPALIAWNGTPEAAAAMRAALPILAKAREVFLLEVEEKRMRYPRDRAARYLSRHAIHVKIIQREAARRDIPDVILDAAAELGAELIVMGGYGHSRLREFVLGGVTRRLLNESTIPLLLAH
jgi:nucleotide-binding universal stress UspA family protein